MISFFLDKLFPKTNQTFIPFLYNDIKIGFQKIKIWIFVSESTNEALKNQDLMKVLKFCVDNIWFSKVTLRIEKCKNIEDLNLGLHLTMRSWLDIDRDSRHEYRFNAKEVLLSILYNEETPDSVRAEALMFYNQISTRNIIPLKKSGFNVIDLPT
jgi:hypothetical protein